MGMLHLSRQITWSKAFCDSLYRPCLCFQHFPKELLLYLAQKGYHVLGPALIVVFNALPPHSAEIQVSQKPYCVVKNCMFESPLDLQQGSDDGLLDGAISTWELYPRTDMTSMHSWRIVIGLFIFLRGQNWLPAFLLLLQEQSISIKESLWNLQMCDGIIRRSLAGFLSASLLFLQLQEEI